MKAVQLIAHGTPGTFELRELPEPQPAPGEVVVQVQACGLNHLDLWLEAGALPVPASLPRTPGCEIAGRVLAVNMSSVRTALPLPVRNERGEGEEAGVLPVAKDIHPWKPGDRVAVQSNLFCGQCEYCARGEESFCLNNIILGVQRDGGFAEKVVVPARALVPLPDTIEFETSAALTLAGSTAMHMLTDRAKVRPGDWVLVIAGASGVGSAAIQIAKGLGARVISTGSTEPKRKLAQQLGALFVLDPNDKSWPAEVRRITGKRGADLVIEHVGGEVLARAFECLARGGAIVTCGATAGRDVPLNLWPFFVKQQRLIGSYGRNSADLKATLDWAASGRLKPVIDSTFPLTETPAAFAHLRSRNVLGKVIVEPFEPVSESD